MKTSANLSMPPKAALQAYLDNELVGDWCEIPFGMSGQIDAPDTIPAGGFYAYDGTVWSGPLPAWLPRA